MKFFKNSMLIPVFAVVLAGLTACQPENKPAEEQNGTSATENATKTEAKKSHRDTVVIYQMQFQPQQLTVNKGDTVIWINKDIVGHNVTEEPGDKILSDTLQTGEAFTLVPDHSINYICSIHPTMKASITVNE